MPLPLQSDATTSTLTPVEAMGGHLPEENPGDSVLKALRAADPARPTETATVTAIALEPNSRQELPPRNLSESTMTLDTFQSSSSSSFGRGSEQPNYDDDQTTPTESAEDEDEVEFVMEPTPVPSEGDTISVAGSENVVDASKHTGNGVTCRYYNKSRCIKGNNCPYSHAPDLYSLRSHPNGRNVCLYFIHNNKCRFKDQKCNYSHRREDLRWNDEELASQLSSKLGIRRSELTAKKEEKRTARTGQFTASAETLKKPLPYALPPISGPLIEVTLPAGPTSDTTLKKGKRKPSKTGPYAAGASLYPPRWDLPQQLDRLQLLRFGLLNWDGSPPQQTYHPPPYVQYPPYHGFPAGGRPY